MTNQKETIEALNLLMNGWQPLPKKFCLEKIFGWAEKDADSFLKEYKKEKRKNEKYQKSLLATAANVSSTCCGQDCCSKD